MWAGFSQPQSLTFEVGLSYIFCRYSNLRLPQYLWAFSKISTLSLRFYLQIPPSTLRRVGLMFNYSWVTYSDPQQKAFFWVASDDESTLTQEQLLNTVVSGARFLFLLSDLRLDTYLSM